MNPVPIYGVLARVLPDTHIEFGMAPVTNSIWLISQLSMELRVAKLFFKSMEVIVYADTTDQETSSASSIASTMQQMSISFGVAAAGLATALFVPSTHSDPTEMIHGIHKALIALGILTILSTIVFRSLRSGDGDDVSLHKVLHPGG